MRAQYFKVFMGVPKSFDDLLYIVGLARTDSNANMEPYEDKNRVVAIHCANNLIDLAMKRAV